MSKNTHGKRDTGHFSRPSGSGGGGGGMLKHTSSALLLASLNATAPITPLKKPGVVKDPSSGGSGGGNSQEQGYGQDNTMGGGANSGSGNGVRDWNRNGNESGKEHRKLFSGWHHLHKRKEGSGGSGDERAGVNLGDRSPDSDGADEGHGHNVGVFTSDSTTTGASGSSGGPSLPPGAAASVFAYPPSGPGTPGTPGTKANNLHLSSPSGFFSNSPASASASSPASTPPSTSATSTIDPPILPPMPALGSLGTLNLNLDNENWEITNSPIHSNWKSKLSSSMGFSSSPSPLAYSSGLEAEINPPPPGDPRMDPGIFGTSAEQRELGIFSSQTTESLPISVEDSLLPPVSASSTTSSPASFTQDLSTSMTGSGTDLDRDRTLRSKHQLSSSSSGASPNLPTMELDREKTIKDKDHHQYSHASIASSRGFKTHRQGSSYSVTMTNSSPLQRYRGLKSTSAESVVNSNNHHYSSSSNISPSSNGTALPSFGDSSGNGSNNHELDEQGYGSPPMLKPHLGVAGHGRATSDSGIGQPGRFSEIEVREEGSPHHPALSSPGRNLGISLPSQTVSTSAIPSSSYYDSASSSTGVVESPVHGDLPGCQQQNAPWLSSQSTSGQQQQPKPSPSSTSQSQFHGRGHSAGNFSISSTLSSATNISSTTTSTNTTGGNDPDRLDPSHAMNRPSVKDLRGISSHSSGLSLSSSSQVHLSGASSSSDNDIDVGDMEPDEIADMFENEGDEELAEGQKPIRLAIRNFTGLEVRMGAWPVRLKRSVKVKVKRKNGDGGEKDGGKSDAGGSDDESNDVAGGKEDDVSDSGGRPRPTLVKTKIKREVRITSHRGEKFLGHEAHRARDKNYFGVGTAPKGNSSVSVMGAPGVIAPWSIDSSSAEPRHSQGGLSASAPKRLSSGAGVSIDVETDGDGFGANGSCGPTPSVTETPPTPNPYNKEEISDNSTLTPSEATSATVTPGPFASTPLEPVSEEIDIGETRDDVENEDGHGGTAAPIPIPNTSTPRPALSPMSLPSSEPTLSSSPHNYSSTTFLSPSSPPTTRGDSYLAGSPPGAGTDSLLPSSPPRLPSTFPYHHASSSLSSTSIPDSRPRPMSTVSLDHRASSTSMRSMGSKSYTVSAPGDTLEPELADELGLVTVGWMTKCGVSEGGLAGGIRGLGELVGLGKKHLHHGWIYLDIVHPDGYLLHVQCYLRLVKPTNGPTTSIHKALVGRLDLDSSASDPLSSGDFNNDAWVEILPGENESDDPTVVFTLGQRMGNYRNFVDDSTRTKNLLIPGKGIVISSWVSHPKVTVSLVAGREARYHEVDTHRHDNRQRLGRIVHSKHAIEGFDNKRTWIYVQHDRVTFFHDFIKIHPITGQSSGKSSLASTLESPAKIFRDLDICANYGFSDSGIRKSNQIYVYISKYRGNWLEQLIQDNPAWRTVPFSCLALAGSHDCGMHTTLDAGLKKFIKHGRMTSLSKTAGATQQTKTDSLLPVIQFVLSVLSALNIKPRRAIQNLANTQKDSTINQLEMGVRFFDMRPGWCFYDCIDSLKITLHHQHSIVPGVRYVQFIVDILTFLATNRQEIVIVELKDDNLIKEGDLIPISMVPSAEELQTAMDEARQSVSSEAQAIQFASCTDMARPIGDLIDENRRFFLIDRVHDVNAWQRADSYDGQAYNTFEPPPILEQLEKTRQQYSRTADIDLMFPSKGPRGTIYQLQATPTAAISRDIAASLTWSDASSLLVYMKAIMDRETYHWIGESDFNDPGNIIFLNDFVDSALVEHAMEVSQERAERYLNKPL